MFAAARGLIANGTGRLYTIGFRHRHSAFHVIPHAVRLCDKAADVLAQIKRDTPAIRKAAVQTAYGTKIFFR